MTRTYNLKVLTLIFGFVIGLEKLSEPLPVPAFDIAAEILVSMLQRCKYCCLGVFLFFLWARVTPWYLAQQD